jgi:putative ABC transport system permease protein
MMTDLFLETVRSLRAHGSRFVLTALGIAWGALMLTFLSGQMAGFAQHFVDELEEIGPKLIFMGPGVVFKDRVGERASRPVELEIEDVLRVQSLESVENASPIYEIWAMPVRHGRRTRLLNIMGVDADADAIRNIHVAEGRFLSKLDVERGARVAFMGPRAKDRLFGAAPALGKTLQLGSQRFRVIGIATRKGDQLMMVGNPDDLLITVPYTTAQRWLVQDDRIYEILIAPKRREEGWRAILGSRQVIALHQQFSPDSEAALWSVDFWDTLSVLFGMLWALRLFLVVAGAITLFVGAVGVMNIMLVVVGERTPEIGVRKALGARGRDLFLQFLAESTFVAGASGLIGTAAGVVLLKATRPAFERAGIQMPDGLDPFTTAVITGSLVVVAIVAGVLPAMRAARVPPAEALRAM